ncbi:MAG: substrate-binding domain-containing protein [Beijerinckiaceae bacterium]|nr:substrate-binding domain-containing protein [Beijerinckiaceae bacterium]
MKTRLAAVAACSLLMTHVVQAAEVRMLAAGAVKETFLELVPQFESTTGNKVVATWTGSADIRKRIGAGEAFDLIIVGAPDIDAFVKDGKVMPGSRVDIARSGVGVAVKAGSPRPDISSSEALKKTLLSARAVVYSTGPSGVYIQRLFDRLGIADQMKDKSKQTAPGMRVAQYLANGEAELGFQQVSELVHEAGIDFLGPLPAEIQNVTVYSSGISIGSNASESAKALQALLSGPVAAPVFKKNGMDPSHP